MPIQALENQPENLIETELKSLNALYRQGQPAVSDNEYDKRRAILKAINPANAFINAVEPEMARDAKGNVSHPSPMLSTDKAYSFDEVAKWINKVVTYASQNGFDSDPLIRLTPKLDGCAARFIPNSKIAFITRGNGTFGTDFTALGNQLVFVGDNSSTCVGEIVCDESYFQQTLKPQGVVHPRNFVAGLISSDTLSHIGLKALEDKAVRFIDYRQMEGAKTLKASELLALGNEMKALEIAIMSNCAYRTDGVVIQIDDNAMFAEMGHNSQFHYGQLAKKIAGEATDAKVICITPQVGKSGKLTPVVSIEPTLIDDVIVSNVTAHHYGNVSNLKLGVGAVISVLRSGSVIPYLQSVRHQAEVVEIPSSCPACHQDTKMVKDFLMCINTDCKGRLAARLQFFTKTLGMDLIGGKAAEKLADHGIDCVGLLSVTASELESAGFGAGQAKNIVAEVDRIKSFQIEDSKLLASIGISKLGRRASKSLLKVHSLETISKLTMKDLIAIEGIADLKAQIFVEGIAREAQMIDSLMDFFDEILPSKIEVDTSSVIADKGIVFTGTMLTAKRGDLSTQAEALGAKVQSSVTSKTNFLIIGANVGESKIAKAQKHGTTVITESEYLALIA